MTPGRFAHALVIVPTYNEIENIERLVGELRALDGNIHVLIVDDNSPDGTGVLADTLAERDTGVHVVFNHTPAILILEALITGDAPVKLLPRKLNKLGLDAFFLQFTEHRLYHKRRITVFPRASVKRNNLHNSLHPEILILTLLS